VTATCAFGIVAENSVMVRSFFSGVSVAGDRRQTSNRVSRRLAAIDQLLTAGIKLGPAKKHAAINRVLELVPEWTRGDCWRRIRELRKTIGPATAERRPADTPKPKTITVASRPTSKPWTPADDDRLLNLAGYEPVPKIAQRLGRSVRAVRFRMGALGMSAKVTDGWSLRALQKLLRVGPSRLRHFIGKGVLRVRDAHITAASLETYCDKNGETWESSVRQTISTALREDDGFTWEKVADLLSIDISRVQDLIAAGELKLANTFVTDRAFEEFCKKHSDEISIALIDPATARWLVKEYGVSPSATDVTSVPRALKHALVVRACKCGRKIAGNPYFRHIKSCQSMTAPAAQRATASAMGQSPNSMEG
jgi:hypothetical protein